MLDQIFNLKVNLYRKSNDITVPSLVSTKIFRGVTIDQFEDSPLGAELREVIFEKMAGVEEDDQANKIAKTMRNQSSRISLVSNNPALTAYLYELLPEVPAEIGMDGSFDPNNYKREVVAWVVTPEPIEPFVPEES